MSLSYRIAPSAAMGPLSRPVVSSAAVRRSVAMPRVSRRHNTRYSDGKLRRNLTPHKKSTTFDHTISRAQRLSYADLMVSGNTPMFPATFVPAPLSEYPSSPFEFLAYHWARIKAWTNCMTSVLQTKLRSQEKWTSRPKWKAHRGKIAPTAKAMYRDMLEAFAAGDRETLARVCTPHFCDQLQRAIERRPANQAIRFEVKDSRGIFYPRLRSHLVSQYNPFDKYSIREQAVVAVSSTQRKSKYIRSTGEPIQGTLKIQDKVEYVVLIRDINSKNWESTRWQIWGTTTSTDLERSREVEEDLVRQHTQAAGWKESPSK